MEANQDDPIVESYWELLKHLDVNTRLALIARLAQSLQGALAAPANVLPPVFRPAVPGTTTTTSLPNQLPGDTSETFWWDALEE